jgi:hypothetical protein
LAGINETLETLFVADVFNGEFEELGPQEINNRAPHKKLKNKLFFISNSLLNLNPTDKIIGYLTNGPISEVD